MKRILTSLLSILVFLVFAASCDRPACENTNPLFDKFPPDSKEYKNELAKQLAIVDKSKLTYWMDSYQETNNIQSILVNIHGSGLCAKILINIKESNKGIEELLKKKGIGYRGAELEELKFDIQQDSESTVFIFKEIDGIAD